MRQISSALILAMAGALGFSCFAPVLSTAHAEATIPSVTMPAGTVQIGGTGVITGHGFTPKNWVYVYYERPDGSTNAVFVQTDTSGTFTVTLGFSAVHGAGLEFVLAYDYGTTHWTPVVTIAVTSGAPVSVRALALSASDVTPGATITVSGESFTPNNWVYVYFQRPNGTTGAFWAQTDAAGAFSSLLGFSASNGCGSEVIWAYDYGTHLWSEPGSIAVSGCSSLDASSDAQLTGAAMPMHPEGAPAVPTTTH